MNCSLERDHAEDGEEGTSGSSGGVTTGEGGSSSGESSSGESSSGDAGSSSTGEAPAPTGCGEMWAQQACEVEGGGEGVQFCRLVDHQKLSWGACVAEVVCQPSALGKCNEDSGYYEYCVLDDDGVPMWEESMEDCGFTPLVLRFEGTARIDLALADGHGFDISGTGSCLASDWPTAATPWLALDRDGDGVIADARELFGSGVVLQTGERARDGFAALAEHDVNGDGRISAADSVWPELLLWSDHDGDRRSTAWELEPLAGRGVTELALAVRVERRCDERGNCEAERSDFKQVLDGRSGAGEVVDVHLVCQ